jgi:hypothetical protein
MLQRATNALESDDYKRRRPMAKGQMKSNKETRKPKKDKTKPPVGKK